MRVEAAKGWEEPSPHSSLEQHHSGAPSFHTEATGSAEEREAVLELTSNPRRRPTPIKPEPRPSLQASGQPDLLPPQNLKSCKLLGLVEPENRVTSCDYFHHLSLK